ncbi:diguanylate cyclase domain-containing protein [Arsenicicoccus bolidensis]|uniref:diguanylate cyclase domain-containing protein n=1 Tax=Arsenicicoccus bolidensis TaxID=229480 RepID=UPI001F0AD6DA|nr:GGDEF domain-containing protein [Arsenicicoccus bolidensis]
MERLGELLDDPVERSEVALIFVDLDRFKQVNDSSGHHAGDALLREVAARITGVTGPGRLLARLGGDEFAVVASAGIEEATELAGHVHDALARPYGLLDRVHQVGASIGVAVAEPGEPRLAPEELL